MSEHVAKIVPATASKHSLKIIELNELFKRVPSLEEDDREAFEEIIEELRTYTSKSNSSDIPM